MRRPSNVIVRRTVLVGLLAGWLAIPVVASPATGSGSAEAAEAPSAWQEIARRPGEGEECLVCRQPIEGEAAVEIRYKGRVFYVKESMLDEFRADPDGYFQRLQARSGLFDEAAMEGPPMHRGWFVFGLYVAVGLLFGALCASLALGRGRRPLPWLVAGLLGNVVALVVLLMRTSGSDSAPGTAALGALGRVTVTRAPRSCPTCGASNHPAATSCSSCGVALEPQTLAETDLVGA